MESRYRPSLTKTFGPSSYIVKRQKYSNLDLFSTLKLQFGSCP